MVQHLLPLIVMWMPWAILLWALHRKFIAKKPLPYLLRLVWRFFRFMLLMATFGLLAM